MPAGSTLIYPYCFNFGISTSDSCYAISEIGLSTVPTFYSCTKCVGSPSIVHDRTSDCHQIILAMRAVKTERNFDLQATWVIDVPGLFFDMFSMGVCTTRHWEVSGRPVQELHVPYRGIGRYVTVTKGLILVVTNVPCV